MSITEKISLLRKKSNKKGFTLFEIIVVIAIIGILAAGLIGNFSGASAAANDKVRMSGLRDVAISLEAYKEQHGFYPCESASEIDGGVDLDSNAIYVTNKLSEKISNTLKDKSIDDVTCNMSGGIQLECILAKDEIISPKGLFRDSKAMAKWGYVVNNSCDQYALCVKTEKITKVTREDGDMLGEDGNQIYAMGTDLSLLQDNGLECTGGSLW